MKSSSQHSFAQVPAVSIPRSSFRRNMTYKTTFDAGYLNCVYLDEVLPGDTFNFSLTPYLRILSPLKYPILDNLKVDFQAYFVPVRLVYDEYEEFFGSSKGQSGHWEYDDSHLMPGITSPSGGWTAGSLADQFGIPIGVADLRVNALPFRCYNRIINDWYLPSSYELTGPVMNTGSSDDSPTDYALWKRLKRPDYFTAALPSPQRGDGVELPLGVSAPVRVDGYTGSDSSLLASNGKEAGFLSQYSSASGYFARPTFDGSVVGASDNNNGFKLFTDLSQATSATINSMRQAFQLQRALERDMRGGVRYVSQLMSHFGVRSPDARLQRSEFLGSASLPVQVHTVANTNGASGSDLASLAAYGVAGQRRCFRFVKSFVEHGYILVLASVRADLTYMQGLPQLFDRWARFDFYYPVFAHLGEQVVKNKYIFAQGSSVTDSSGNVIDEQPFAYQEIYGEYRYGVSKITGQLRSTYAQPLDAWHLAQKFNNLPTLNMQFLEENVPMSRVKAVTSGPDFLYDSLIELNCVRPMPLFGVPGLIDHG